MKIGHFNYHPKKIEDTASITATPMRQWLKLSLSDSYSSSSLILFIFNFDVLYNNGFKPLATGGYILPIK